MAPTARGQATLNGLRSSSVRIHAVASSGKSARPATTVISSTRDRSPHERAASGSILPLAIAGRQRRDVRREFQQALGHARGQSLPLDDPDSISTWFSLLVWARA